MVNGQARGHRIGSGDPSLPSRSTRGPHLIPSLIFAAVALAGQTAAAVEAPFEVEAPSMVLRDVPFALTLRFTPGAEPESEFEWRALGREGRLAGERGKTAHAIEGLRLVATGAHAFDVEAAGRTRRVSLRALPGAVSLLPAVVAIALAVVLHEALLALLVGVWLGAWLVFGGDPFRALLHTVDRYALGALADKDHAAILLFSVLFGGMVGVVSRSGGSLGIAERITRMARTRRGGQLGTWFLGVIFFFDDYANALLCGPTMRPVTDRLRISREKLSYLVDSTSAPIASLALISTWIGVEVSYIGNELSALGIDRNPYETFVASIPYRFYPLLALWLALLVSWTGRDFGAMRRAERRAFEKGEVLRSGAVPASDLDDPSLRPPEGLVPRWWLAAMPIAVVIVTLVGGMYATGRGEVERGLLDATGFGDGISILRDVYGNADPYSPLLWAALLGGLVAAGLAWASRALRVREAAAAHLAGCKSMIVAVAVLTLAWSLGQVCKDLHTAEYLVGVLREAELGAAWLPALVFLVSAGTSFATGTSWGTMGILFPLVIPAAHGLAPGNEPILLGVISSILAGSVFGDHCSPLSDTTILSSMSCSADHIDHVRTQMPYALVCGAAGLIVGDIPSGLGWWGPWLGLVLGMAAVAALLFAFGRSAEGG